jgi:hypothetical protein
MMHAAAAAGLGNMHRNTHNLERSTQVTAAAAAAAVAAAALLQLPGSVP